MTVVASSADRGRVAKLLHWVSAVLLLGLLGTGFYAVEVLTGQDGDTLLARFNLTQTHKSWGVVAFAVVLVRVVWLLLARRRRVEPSAQNNLARSVHLAMYACMVILPLNGWLMASASPLQDAYGLKNLVFGLFELPDPFVPGSEDLRVALGRVHFYAGLALLLLVTGHIAAACYHHFVLRDDVLAKMTKLV
ncbi:MAG: cytochrome b/b6 domain-containing protein [Pseudomonadota bacterium]